MDGELTPAQIAELARVHLGPDDGTVFADLVRPAVALARQLDLQSGGRTRLGGKPLLARDQVWPNWHGKALSFIALIDLAELRGFETDLDLPTSGLVNLFYEADEQRAWGFDPTHADGWRVLFTPDGTERSTPEGALTFETIPLVPQQMFTAPSWEEESVARIYARSREGLLALGEELDAQPRHLGPRHQIGGWPSLQQGPIQLECQLASNGIYVGGPGGYADPRAAQLKAGAVDWRLLAQIDTDDDAGWMWGDVGCLYYSMRASDIALGAFDRTWMVLQCG
jgi:uncharacterized protein YwqG